MESANRLRTRRYRIAVGSTRVAALLARQARVIPPWSGHLLPEERARARFVCRRGYWLWLQSLVGAQALARGYIERGGQKVRTGPSLVPPRSVAARGLLFWRQAMNRSVTTDVRIQRFARRARGRWSPGRISGVPPSISPPHLLFGGAPCGASSPAIMADGPNRSGPGFGSMWHRGARSRSRGGVIRGETTGVLVPCSTDQCPRIASFLAPPSLGGWPFCCFSCVRTGGSQHDLPCEPRSVGTPATASCLSPQPSLPPAPAPAPTPLPAPSPGRPPPTASVQPSLTFDDVSRALGRLGGEPRTGVRFSIHFAVMRALNESRANTFAEAVQIF